MDQSLDIKAIKAFEEKCQRLLPRLSDEGFYDLFAEACRLAPRLTDSDWAGLLGITPHSVALWRQRKSCAATPSIRTMVVEVIGRVLMRQATNPPPPREVTQRMPAVRKNLVELGLVEPGEVVPFKR